MAEETTHKYSSKLTDKYDVVGKSMQPAKVSFGDRYGNLVADLRQDSCLKVVDHLVKTYPHQPFFRLKDKPGENHAPGRRQIPIKQ